MGAPHRTPRCRRVNRKAVKIPPVAFLIGIGILLFIVGGFLLWASTAGREWSSTHNRSFQRTARVSKRQETYNVTAGVIGGGVSIAAGVALIIVGISRG